MRIIHLCKFESLHDQEPEPVTIIINSELPDFEALAQSDDILGPMAELYQNEAKLLVDILYNALPQGTFDRLGIEFMKKKVSLYRGKTDG